MNLGTWSSTKPVVSKSKETQFSETEPVGSENQRKHSLLELEQNLFSKKMRVISRSENSTKPGFPKNRGKLRIPKLNRL